MRKKKLIKNQKRNNSKAIWDLRFRIFDLDGRESFLAHGDLRTIVLCLGGFGKLDSRIGGSKVCGGGREWIVKDAKGGERLESGPFESWL